MTLWKYASHGKLRIDSFFSQFYNYKMLVIVGLSNCEKNDFILNSLWHSMALLQTILLVRDSTFNAR